MKSEDGYSTIELLQNRWIPGEGRRNYPNSSTAVYWFPENKTEVQATASIYHWLHVVMNF